MKLRTLVTGFVAVALSLTVASCSKNDAQPVPGSSTWPSGITEALIKSTVNDFLAEYKGCIATKSRAYCAAHNSHVTADFPKAIAKNGSAAKGWDPVTCLARFPDSYGINVASVVRDGDGFAGVSETYGKKSKVIFFQVKMYGPALQIISNTCP